MTQQEKGAPPVFLAPEPPPDDGGGYDPDRRPEGWPTHGTLRGWPVPLRGITRRLSAQDLEELVVVIGGERQRPFRTAETVEFPPGGGFVIR